jgi:tetratricopeptide (TPR) repeat protein
MVETGDEARLFDLVPRCGERLRRRLGVAAATESQTRSFRAAFPTNQHALQLYSEAIRRVRRFESMGARDLLLAAIREDPNNAVIRSSLAAVHGLLGADKLAADEARKAFEQSAGLSREQQLLIEGRFRAASRERDKAITIFRALFSFFPDNVDYGVMLARNQYQAGKGKEALATIEELQKLPAPLSQDPQIPLTEAFAAMASSDFPRELSASTRAVRAAAAVNARLLVARARIPEAWALRNLGRPAEARKSLEEAYRIYEEAGDRHGLVETLNPLAILHYDERDLAGAGKLWEEALAHYREAGARYATSLALQNLAAVQMDLWNLEAARHSYLESLEVGLEIDRKPAIGAAHSGLAEVTRYLGHLNESFEHYTQALNVSREGGDLSRTAESLFGQAQVFRLKGDLNRARQLHTQALKLRQETKQPAHEAGSRLAIARIAMDAGRFAEAESEARLAGEAFTRVRRTTSAAEADILVAESLIERQRDSEALAMLPRIEEGLKRGDNTQLARRDLLRAKVHAATGQTAEASKLLEAVTARTATGPLELHYDVRFHWGVIERQRGSEPAGLKMLGTLSAEARGKGFKLIADKAAKALQAPRR